MLFSGGILVKKEGKRRKLKVCLIAPVPPPYGGIANWTTNLINMLDENKINFELVNIAPEKRITERRTLYNRIVDSGLAMLSQRKKLVQLIKGNKINVIHMTTSGQLALIRDIIFLHEASKYSIPVSYHIHFGKIPQIIENDGMEWKFLRKAFRLADKVIAIDKKTYDEIKKVMPELDVEYIPNSISSKKLPVAKEPEKKEVTFLGWCIKEKGIEELLLAWKQIADMYEWELNLIGPYDDNYIEKLSNSVTLKKVNFLGELEHEKAMKMLSKSSIFILPSYSEGFPMSVLEAMALGKAIIATKVGAVPEMLGGECGELIDKQNVGQIVNALKKLIEDEKLRNKYGENAEIKVKENYLDSIIFKRYKNCWLKKD